MNMARNPIVAGKFYSAKAGRLEKDIEGYIEKKPKRINAIGCVSPHAGYIYSGGVAGKVFSSIQPKTTYVILGPNHTGMGIQFGLDANQSWLTPLGEVFIDQNLKEAILAKSKLIEEDSQCHAYEHSIEVQIPFLQMTNSDFKIVPIVISYSDLDDYIEIGDNIADAIKETKSDVVIIASSDMTHYETDESAKKKDKSAIDKILDLNVEEFLKEVHLKDISMCGYAPTAVMMTAAKKLGAKKTELVMYATSAEVSGDYNHVVGYAGIVVY